MKQTKLLFSVLLLASFLISIGCGKTLSRKPAAIGSIGQVTVVAENSVWNSFVGDTFSYHYEAPYLILPSPEPIYDVAQYTPSSLPAIKRELHTIVLIANVSDTESPTSKWVIDAVGEEIIGKAKNDANYRTASQKDRWASGQNVFYIFAHTDEDLAKAITKSFPKINSAIRERDQPVIKAQAYSQGVHKGYTDEVLAKTGMLVNIPGGYKKAEVIDDFMWYRYDGPKNTTNLMFYVEPYVDESQLTSEHLKTIRDSLGYKYVSTLQENSFMKINDIDLPVFYTNKTVNGHFAIEARGIWEMENDYMGGSFISYLVYNKKAGKLVFMDGFVRAPGQDKRLKMQCLEYIFSTIQF